ncbi:MAG: universal stress protein [Actinomycetota bacterium]|nr:universal stress protein [Actinomycetota bacterium]
MKNDEIKPHDSGELFLRINKIILATDGSIPSLMATQYAIALARIFGAKVKAIFVDSTDEYLEVNSDEDIIKTRYNNTGLDLVEQYAIRNGVSYETEIVHGAIAKTIIKTADEYGADLIIVGNTGRTGLKRLALGSVSEAVVKNSPIPVLVIKAS